MDLEPGVYRNSPPFDIPFTFEVAEPGWESGHLLGEYFDIVRFERRPSPGTPEVSLAFAHPTSIEGATTLPAAGLTPGEAASALAGRTDLIVGDSTPFSLDGREGVRVDVHADRPNTTLFRGPGGALGVGPTQDTRLCVVPLDDDLLLVLVMADPEDLEAAWQRVQPVLASVDL